MLFAYAQEKPNTIHSCNTLTHLLERVWRTMQKSLTYLHTKVPNLAIIENIILYDV